MNNDLVTELIIGSAIEVHRELGPGLLENIYEKCLILELEKKKLKIERQKVIPLIYKGISLDCVHRLDLLIENEVIVEIKSVKELCAIHLSQLLSYLKLIRGGRGLLINFNVPILKDGIKRVSLKKIL